MRDRHRSCLLTSAATWCVFGVFVSALSAAPTTITVNFHAGPGEPALLDTTGALITAGAEVRAGWIEPTFNVARDGWNPAAVAAAFHEFGRTDVRAIFGANGRFAGAVSGDGATFAGHAISLWIVYTPDAELAGPASNITAHALVMSTAPNWRFPHGAALPPGNSATLALGNADQVVLGVAGAGAIVDLRLAETGYRYSVWRGTAFAAGAANTNPGDDADGDGVNNFIEFFAGTNPLVANAPPALAGVEVSGGQRWLVLTMSRSPWARGVAAGIEESANQVTWTPVADSQLSGDGVSTFAQSSRVPAPDTAAGERRYLRAVVRTAP